MNTFGNIFKLSIFGESHGKSVGIVIDGVPAGIPFNEEDLLPDLLRRKSGAKGTTPRIETDQPQIMSGTFNAKTTGAPIMILFENTNTRSRDYSAFVATPRPGHADFTAHQKFGGYTDYRGGGHFSGRLTLGIVAAGVLAKKMINPIFVSSNILEVGGDANIERAIEKAIHNQDSIGGIIEVNAQNLPVGLGEPFFDSIESRMAHMAFAIPAIKGIEFGSGFQAAKMMGSEHNDNFIDETGKTETNFAGGINGGISNGNNLVFRIVVKPTSSTSRVQSTFNFSTKTMRDLKVEGRHDTCIALRVPPVIEAATAIVLADFMLMAQKIAPIN